MQDRVFLGGSYVDPHYRARREGAFVLAVNCGQAAATCFCVSMSTGPKAERGFDLALTELDPDGDHRFLIEVGSERGAQLLAEVSHRTASERDRATARAVSERTAASMGREMPDVDMQDLLMRNLEHPRWNDVAGRCLTCGNCTMVCPTCFCTNTEEDLDLTGETAGRTRKWTSCYTLDFSYIHGGSVRTHREVPLPAMDDPQARDLVRPVRHLGLRRLRSLHHLVPGRHRHHRGSPGDPGQ